MHMCRGSRRGGREGRQVSAARMGSGDLAKTAVLFEANCKPEGWRDALWAQNHVTWSKLCGLLRPGAFT